MGTQPWLRRIFPPIERLGEPGSTFGTAVGVFLAYASPVFLTMAAVPLLDGNLWLGLGVGALAVASWVMGHWLVRR